MRRSCMTFSTIFLENNGLIVYRGHTVFRVSTIATPMFWALGAPWAWPLSVERGLQRRKARGRYSQEGASESRFKSTDAWNELRLLRSCQHDTYHRSNSHEGLHQRTWLFNGSFAVWFSAFLLGVPLRLYRPLLPLLCSHHLLLV